MKKHETNKLHHCMSAQLGQLGAAQRIIDVVWWNHKEGTPVKEALTRAKQAIDEAADVIWKQLPRMRPKGPQ